MKQIYRIGIFVLFLVSCNTGNQKNSTNSVNHDSIETTSDSPKAKSPDFCPELVKEILKSSPRYKELTNGLLAAVKKNGGKEVGISLDKSPTPKEDNALSYSSYYEMEVSENYTDRHVNVAHFSFDPKKQQLYEYDVVRDQLITIDFDRNLLSGQNEFCK